MAQSPEIISETEITGLGHSGDGVAEIDGRRVYVPYTAPGDRVEIKTAPDESDRAELRRIVRYGDGRAAPPCRHYGDCGGCALQHLSDPFVAAWKRQLIIDALASRGLHGVAVRPTLTMPAASRRRAAFTLNHDANGVQIGFHARMSNRLVSISECCVLDARIVRALPGLGQLLYPLLRPGQSARLLVTWTETGLDADVQFGTGRKSEPNLRQRTQIAAVMENIDLARLSWNGAVLLERRKPLVMMADTPVCPPPGAFLQASEPGQAALTALVLEAAGRTILGARGARILDLFAGCGTFTFPVAAYVRVHAVEGNEAMTEAIRHASRHAQGLKQIEVSQRDLQRAPLRPDELSPYGAIIFDPPKAGARAQAEIIARCAIPRVVSVSCAPATFARDARTLADGGYRLVWVAPVDQFRWSAEIELVALFERD
ncbi:MAG: TRAM domain-containing protein [Alphaproteobacteria bacterium]